MKTTFEKGKMTFKFETKNISGDFLAKFDTKITADIKKHKPNTIIFDMDGVQKITSAILRRFLRLKNAGFTVEIINATKPVVEIMAITSIDKMISVSHKRNFINTKGLKEIAHGAYGKIYEYGKDEVLKVYYGFLPEEQVLRGVKNGKVAFEHGLPVAIPYATVDTNEGIGVLLENVKGTVLSDVVHDDPKALKLRCTEIAQLAKLISNTHFEPDELSSIKEIYINSLDPISHMLSKESVDAFKIAIQALPDVTTAVHGDLATPNVLFDGHDLIMVDMDTFSFAHPIWDVASMYTAHYYCYLKGDEEENFYYNHMTCLECKHVWDTFEAEYFKGVNKKERKRRINAAASYGMLRAAALYAQKLENYDENNEIHVAYFGFLKPLLEEVVVKNLYSMVEIFNTWKVDGQK